MRARLPWVLGAFGGVLLGSLAAGCSASTAKGPDAGPVDAGSSIGRLVVEPTWLAFGLQPVGATCATRAVTLRNSGSGPLRIHQLEVDPPFELVSPPAALDLPAQETRTVEVRLQADRAGELEGRLRLRLDDAPAQARVALHGRGVVIDDAATGDMLPRSLDFGAVGLGSSGTRELVLTSCRGSGSKVRMTGSPVFVVQPEEVRQAAGTGVLRFDVRFVPDRVGLFTGILLIESESAGYAALQGLHVAGVATGDEVAELAVKPTALWFGAQTAGSESRPKVIRLENGGAEAMVLKRVELASPMFRIHKAPERIPAASAGEIEVTYAPGAVAPYGQGAVLEIEAESWAETVHVYLEGAAVSDSRVANVDPVWVDFGEVATGSPGPSRQVLIWNGGTEPITLASIRVGGPFVVLTQVEPRALAVNEVQSVEIALEPDRPGQTAADLEITFGGVVRRVWLTGIGAD